MRHKLIGDVSDWTTRVRSSASSKSVPDGGTARRGRIADGEPSRSSADGSAGSAPRSGRLRRKSVDEGRGDHCGFPCDLLGRQSYHGAINAANRSAVEAGQTVSGGETQISNDTPKSPALRPLDAQSKNSPSTSLPLRVPGTDRHGSSTFSLASCLQICGRQGRARPPVRWTRRAVALPRPQKPVLGRV